MLQQDRRKAVLGPGESDPLGPYSENFHLRKGLEARDPVNHTVFRQAERKFKKSWLNVPSSIRDPVITGQLSDSDLKGSFNSNIKYISYDKYSHSLPKDSLLYPGTDLRVITFPNMPGLIYIPKMIPPPSQLELLISSMKDGMKPPAASNLDVLFEEGKIVETKIRLNTQTLSCIPKEGLFSKINFDPSNSSDAAVALFRKYRWVVLGVQYDWTSKEYFWDVPHVPIPPLISQLSIEICDVLLGPSEKKYRPEAGIINYYQPGDTLTGHVDRSELDSTSPLISISLGLDCIFLVGGLSRDDPVLPFCLSSGDVLILMNESRRYYHGVPLIIPGSLPDYLLSKNLSRTKPINYSEANLALRLLEEARINLNIRQVWPEETLSYKPNLI